MAGRKSQKAQSSHQDIDFSDMIFADEESDAMVGMMSGLIEASHNAVQASIELTKLIVANHPGDSMSEEEILASFRRTLETVKSVSPLNEMLQQS